MNNKHGTQFGLIIGIAFSVIIAVFFLLRAQGVTAQRNAPDDVKLTYSQNAINAATLKLTKKARPHTYDHVGQVILYNYVIKNTGTVPITATFTVTDDKLSVINCTQPADGALSPNERMICRGSYTITQPDLDAGHVTNHATASGGGITSNQDSATVNATRRPSLRLTKAAFTSTYDHVGQIIDYSYVILNSGNVTLTGPFSVTDNKAAVVNCVQPEDGALSPGESMTCTSSYAIIQADLDAGTLTNTATASGGGVTSLAATATVIAVQTKSLLLAKSADPLVFDTVGQAITYSYVIKNTGNVTLTSVFSITDNKVTPVPCAQPIDGALSPGETMNCSATYTIIQGDLDAGSVTNLATATGAGVTSNQDSATVTASTSHALLLTKLGEPQTYNQAGQSISYTYVIKNIGNVSLTGPFSITDDKSPDVSCTQPTDDILAPQATMDCSATYTILQSDMDAGSVVNAASASGGGVSSNQATEIVTAIQTRSLLLKKTANPQRYSQVGQTIDYSYVITNTGNVTLSGTFELVDDKAAEVSCDQPLDGALSPKEAMQCTGSYTILQADLDAGSVVNHAMASLGLINSQASATVYADQVQSLRLTKAASPLTYSQVGDTITYNYTLQNLGNVTLSGPFSVADDTVVPDPVCTQPAGGVLAPGASTGCTASYTITQADLDAGSVTNLASASGATVTSNVDSATVVASQAYSLLLVKTASPLTYDHVGQEISYSYLITNVGNTTLFDIAVIDDKASVNCPDTSAGLAPAGQITCTASYTINQASLDAGSVTNTASASAGSVQSPPDSETVTANQLPLLAVVKSATPGSYSTVGEVLHYTLVATNEGNVTLSNVSISDPLLATLNCTPAQPSTLAPLATLSCTGSYTITQADLNLGEVDNTATASGNFGNTVVTDTDRKSIPANQSPHLGITKSALPTVYDAVGQVINYTIVATNDGNVSLAGVTVSDPSVTSLSCSPANGSSLAPGASLNCSATHTVVQADLDAGSFANTACVDDGVGGASEACASREVTGTQAPALLLDKSADPTTYSAVDEVISYSYAIKNTGNVTISGPFTVFDDKASDETCPASPTILAPGESITCSASYSIVQNDITSGSVTNQAHATGTFDSEAVTSNTDTVTIDYVKITYYYYLPLVEKSAQYGIHIQPSSYNYVLSGTLFVIGEVWNNTVNSYNTVNVPINFYDANGSIISSSSTNLAPAILLGGDTGCFKIVVPVPPNWSYYQFGTLTYLNRTSSAGLVITNHNGAYNTSTGDYTITGQVQNTGSQVATTVSVGATLYDSSGTLVGCGSTAGVGITLNPGQIGSFVINFPGLYGDYIDVTADILRISGAP